MYLKRHYEPASLEKWQTAREKFVEDNVADLIPHMSRQQAVTTLRNRFADENERPAMTHIEVLRLTKEWRPSKVIIQQGVAEGWASLGKGVITLHTAEDQPDIEFDILRAPGIYSCFDGKRFASVKEAQEALEPLLEESQSPDPDNPAGYLHTTSFECVVTDDTLAALKGGSDG